MKGILSLKICLTLAVISTLTDNGLGAPTKGRYMWVNCRPDSKNANCQTQRGPLVELPGPPDRLPSTAVKDIVQKETVSELEEQSGEGSATGPFLADQGSGDVYGVDYAEFAMPVDQALPHAQELKEDHLIM
ncbi:serglycin precursor [Esox lucius]|uniref:Serglycin n=1 Tax=Esox lucius TaxID=8010 RepID=C1BWN6_ESOLU|nr:serglycin precursor [Esox lucius]ACO13439.1 Serglycin precursor [Esox lucius]